MRAPASHAAGVGAVLQAGDDPHRRLVVVIRQIFDRRMLALIAFLGRARRRRAAGIARADDLVVGALVPDLDRFLDLAILDHQEAPSLIVAAVGLKMLCAITQSSTKTTF